MRVNSGFLLQRRTNIFIWFVILNSTQFGLLYITNEYIGGLHDSDFESIYMVMKIMLELDLQFWRDIIARNHLYYSHNLTPYFR